MTGNSIVVANYTTATTSWEWKYSTDGGATWNAYAAVSGNFYEFAMSYVPGTNNMFVATSPYSTSIMGVAYSNDGGLNWVDYTDPIFLQNSSAENMQMLGVGFVNQNNGWVGNYNYFGGYNSILRYQKNNLTRHSVVATALQVVTDVDAGTVSGMGNYNTGASVTLIATPLPGYTFEKWISYPTQADLGTNATYTFTMPANNVAVLASFVQSMGTDATLSNLTVNGTTVAGFSSSTNTYNVILPSGTTTVPTVTGTPTDPLGVVIVTPATALPGSTIIVVTADDGITTNTYTVNFTVAVATDATLSNLSVDGTTVTGFAPATLTYTVELPYGTTTIPTVTATTTDANATYVITPATILPGSTTIAVTSQDASVNSTYTINFTFGLPNTDATLSDLLVNGTTVTGFAPATLTYAVVLPFGTTVVPTVTATTTDVNATTVITPAATVTGTSTIAVTAQDASTIITYTINFSVAATPSTDATLSDLKVDGTTVTGFAPATLTYAVELPYGTTTIPTVTATTTDANATTVITQATTVTGSATVAVTAQDASTVITYTVNYTVAPNTVATLTDLTVGGTTVAGFDANVFDYTVELPYGTTAVPAVVATTTDVNASKVVTAATALPGTTTIVVTAEDASTVLTYNVHFTLAAQTNTINFSVVNGNGTLVAALNAVPISDGTLVESGNNVIFTAIPAVNYAVKEWKLNNVIVTGNTTNTYTLTNVSANSTVTVEFKSTVGISEVDNHSASIYPNPATNNVTIALDSKQAGVFNVNIVDLTGKSVYTNSLEANATMNVDVTAFAKGVYFVKINNDKTQFVQKLIVK